MKPPTPIAAGFLLALLTASGLRAQEEPSPEIAGLQQAAADFVLAYNAKDAAAVAALFTENGEISDLRAEDTTTGRVDIQLRYAEIFAAAETPSVAIEVDSVRFIGKDLAIEDGTLHFTPPGENIPAKSTAYTAVLQKSADGAWQIASTRALADTTGPAGQLAELAAALKGDWTAMRDGLRLDLAFGWDGSGNFVAGEMLATTADGEPQSTNLRIGWDAARKTITWWSFDDGGGFAKGDWTPTEDGWLIRTEGTTADGESTSANQSLKLEGKDVILWNAADRLVDGEKLPDIEMRVVRQAPEPAAE
jgi:uncharacterized protein (TIGR02246 family)